MNPRFSMWRSLLRKGKSSEHWRSIPRLSDFKAQAGNPHNNGLGGDVKRKMGTCLGQALSESPLSPNWGPQPCATLWIGGTLTGQAGLAVSPEPSDSWGGPGRPAFSFGKGGTWDFVLREMVNHDSLPFHEWQSFNFRHSIRWDFCSPGSDRESHFVFQVFWV